MLAIIWCCSWSMTAVCIGATSGKPKNCRASSGVQSISTVTFMSAPIRLLTPQYHRDQCNQASHLCKATALYAVNRQIGSAEALGRKRSRIGERRLAGHHLRQQPPGHGAER